jgi:hypothetical protein
MDNDLLTLDLRTLPGARETIAYQDGGLFPVLVSYPLPPGQPIPPSPTSPRCCAAAPVTWVDEWDLYEPRLAGE